MTRPEDYQKSERFKEIALITYQPLLIRVRARDSGLVEFKKTNTLALRP